MNSSIHQSSSILTTLLLCICFTNDPDFHLHLPSYPTTITVSNVGSFQLPDPAGRAGGACTSTLLNVLYKDKVRPADKSFKDVLLEMREILDSKGFTQIPQLSSSRNLDVETKFDITPDGFHGTKRAVMIGINYVGQQGELAGCHNDVLNMKEYLMDAHEFEEENMTILMDDGVHPDPTRDNIMYAYRKIVAESQAGDVVYLHYSGRSYFLCDSFTISFKTFVNPIFSFVHIYFNRPWRKTSGKV